MYYLAKIKGIKETETTTELLIHIPEEQIKDKILREKAFNVEIRIDDGRSISNDQRKKIFATVKDIAAFTGDNPEFLRQLLTYEYCAESGENYFSLSDCSMTTAREFITHILDFALRYNIPLSDLGLNRTDDINRYLYSCIKYRRCCITGEQGAEIHHVTGSRVGMGRSRLKINHAGLELMALSRKWHNKVHTEGEVDIFNLYKIYGIKVDAITLNSLGIKAEDIS